MSLTLTPPFSPRASPPKPPHNPSLQSTIHLLDSLVDFYQNERMWVYRTRAALHQDNNIPPDNNSESSSSESLPSPITESDSTESSESLSTVPSRWLRRKRGYNMRLDGLGPKNDRGLATNRTIPQREKILEMFEKMVEARMESCQRVNQLVKNVNRPVT